MKILSTITVFTLISLVSAEFNLQNVPALDALSAIQEKCDKSGGNGTYTNLKEAGEKLQTCFENFVDFSVLNNELEEAKKTGSMDEVFAKYCAKRSKLSSCGQNFISALRPCLNDEENKALNTTLDTLKQLGEFACFRDGDRIAMFIAEGGVECIEDHAEGVKNCINSTFQININSNSLPNLLIDKKKCDDLGKLQSCVVEELEKCKNSTPANIVDALFRFIKRSACSNKNKRSIHKIIRRSLTAGNSFYDLEELKEKTYKLMETKCSSNAPNGAYEAFNKSMENSQECINKTVKIHPLIITPLDEFKKNIKACVEDLIEKARNCLPDNEKYWPQFQFDALYNLIDVIYKTNDILTQPTSRTEMVDCFQKFKRPEARNKMIQCLKQTTDDNIEKEVVCGRLRDAKTCVSELLKKECIREITISQLSEEFFDALLAPCSKKY